MDKLPTYILKGLCRLIALLAEALYKTSVYCFSHCMAHNVRSGIIGPWDDSPPPRAFKLAVWDYRGVARPIDIHLTNNHFPLGRYREPHRWKATQEIGLSKAVLNQHCIVLGPTRSGKTASVIAPWIYHGLRLGHTVIALDVKGRGSLLEEVKRYSSLCGKLGVSVINWDYTNPGGSASWNWIHDLRNDSQINAAVEAICGRACASDPNRFFHQSAIKYLRGLLQLISASHSGYCLRDILRILNDQDALEHLVSQDLRHPGAQRLIELVGLPRADYVKYTMELQTHLEVLDHQGFHEVTARKQFSIDMLDCHVPVLLIVTAPTSDGSLADAACSLFLSQYIQRVLTRFGGTHRPNLLVLDEAARLQDRIDLASTLSLVAGADVSVLMATQDIMQFREECRHEVLANCGNVICLPRVSRSTTEFLAGRLGEMKFTTVTQNGSHWRSVFNAPTWATSIEKAPLLGHREISTPHPWLGQWSAVVHSPSLSSRPILVDLSRKDLQ